MQLLLELGGRHPPFAKALAARRRHPVVQENRELPGDGRSVPAASVGRRRAPVPAEALLDLPRQRLGKRRAVANGPSAPQPEASAQLAELLQAIDRVCQLADEVEPGRRERLLERQRAERKVLVEPGAVRVVDQEAGVSRQQCGARTECRRHGSRCVLEGSRSPA
jgi:hypothetical protein